MKSGGTGRAAWSVRCGSSLALLMTLGACNGHIQFEAGDAAVALGDAGASGGISGNAGGLGTGGAVATGGSPGTGGSSNSGGTPGTGGSPGTGGTSGPGGAAGGGRAGAGGRGGGAGATATDCAQGGQRCPLSTLHCDVASRSCVACTSDTDCTSSFVSMWNRCNLTLHQCIECTVDADCGRGRLCRSNSCVTPCTEGESGSDDTNSMCPTAQSYCEHDVGFCVACDSEHYVCSGDAVICSPRGICIQCVTDAQCAGKAGTTRCNSVTGRCVACVNSTHCLGSGMACNPVSNTCVVPPPAP
jgi:hypothetical protein